ncbi:MAG TPA: response regulator [Burkholderiales bacterium]
MIIEDEEVLAENIGIYLGAGGAEVLIAHSGEEALRYAAQFAPQCVISDFNLPGINGVETMRQLRERFPNLWCVLITGHGSEAVFAEARGNGVDHVLLKPFALPDLGTSLCSHSRADASEAFGADTQVESHA